MNSELLKSVFQDELERTNRLIKRYEAELGTLPKGSVFKRKIGNQEYLYLNYRNGGKVLSKFLGNVKDFPLEDFMQKLDKRKELTALLKKLVADKKALEKELAK